MAAPGESTTLAGEAEASVVEPIGIQKVADLRFGRIMQPASGGSITIATNSTATVTGGLVGQAATPQVTNGRGSAVFGVFGDRNRWFLVTLPGTIAVSNGTQTMSVSNFNANTFFGFVRLDNTGFAPLSVGGRLNVNANQQVGSYTGTFNVTVLYL